MTDGRFNVYPCGLTEFPPRSGTLPLVFLGAFGGQAVQVKGPAKGALSDINEVWAREEAYWRFVKAGDVENY